MSGPDDDLRFSRQRVDALLRALEQLAAGETLTTLPISPQHDELDAVAFCVKVLADELRWTNRRMIEAERQIARDLRRSVDAAARAPDGLHALEGIRILLAEDDPDLQAAIRRLLSSAGADVECTADGGEAVAMAASGRYDVVLMDLLMPQGSGLAATRTLRSRGCTLPVIALTADATTESRLASAEAGCSAIVAKPVDSDHLIASISGLVHAPPARS